MNDSNNRTEINLQNLIKEYQELNSSEIDEITDRIPNPIELSRQIYKNRPLVIRSYLQQQEKGKRSLNDGIDENLKDHYHRASPLEFWTESNLIHKLGAQRLVTVAKTPFGNADSVVDDKYFVEPVYEKMKMIDFFNRLRKNSSKSDKFSEEKRSISSSSSSSSRREGFIEDEDDEEGEDEEVLYLQTQNGNLLNELEPLMDDVGLNVPIASEALGMDKPDAINLWIGDERSSTSLHKDPYENFYLVLKGSKSFKLYPPIEFYCMHEKEFIKSNYIYDSDDGDEKVSKISKDEKDSQVEELKDENDKKFLSEDEGRLRKKKKKKKKKWKILPEKKLEREDEYNSIPWIPIDLKKFEKLEKLENPGGKINNDDDLKGLEGSEGVLESFYDRYPRFRFSRPIEVKVYPGDLLYLPSLWFHHVDQEPIKDQTDPDPKDDHLIIACNWWYDMDYSGSHYSYFQFIRNQVLSLDDS